MTQDVCLIHVKDMGGEIQILSANTGEVLFDPSMRDEEKMHAILPLVSSGRYPIEFEAKIVVSSGKRRVLFEDEGVLFDIDIESGVRSILVTWGD